MKRFVKDVKKYSKYAVYSARATLKTEVAGSYLNWIWWILEPVGLMLVYAFMFGFIFNAREPYFPAFIFTGLTIWTFFNINMKSSVKIIKKNKSIISKIYLPKFVLIESTMMVNGFKMLISFGIVVGLMIFYRIPLTWNVLYMIPILLCIIILNFGFMIILMHCGVYVQDLVNVLNISMKFIFYMTGIMFSIQNRIGSTHPALATVLEKANPIAFLISSARKCMLYGETPDVLLLMIWTLAGVLISVVGIQIMYKNENTYIKVI